MVSTMSQSKYHSNPQSISTVQKEMGISLSTILHLCATKELIATTLCPEVDEHLVLMPTVFNSKQSKVKKYFLVEDFRLTADSPDFLNRENLIKYTMEVGTEPFFGEISYWSVESHKDGLFVDLENVIIDADAVAELSFEKLRIDNVEFKIYYGRACFNLSQDVGIFKMLTKLHNLTRNSPDLYLPPSAFMDVNGTNHGDYSFPKLFRSVELSSLFKILITSEGMTKNRKYRLNAYDMDLSELES